MAIDRPDTGYNIPFIGTSIACSSARSVQKKAMCKSVLTIEHSKLTLNVRRRRVISVGYFTGIPRVHFSSTVPVPANTTVPLVSAIKITNNSINILLLQLNILSDVSPIPFAHVVTCTAAFVRHLMMRCWSIIALIGETAKPESDAKNVVEPVRLDAGDVG